MNFKYYKNQKPPSKDSNNTELFIDPLFKPDVSSLGEDLDEREDIEWLPIRCLMKNPVIFDKIECNDVLYWC